MVCRLVYTRKDTAAFKSWAKKKPRKQKNRKTEKTGAGKQRRFGFGTSDRTSSQIVDYRLQVADCRELSLAISYEEDLIAT